LQVSNKHFSAPALALLVFITLGVGCSQNAVHWSELVPRSALFVVVSAENSTINDLLDQPYIPLFDGISPSAMQLLSDINQHETDDAIVEAMILYPDTSEDWQPIWILQSVDELMEYLKEKYQEQFTQNRYDFENFTVEKLFIADRELFAVDIGSYMLMSESSYGIEQSIRTLSGNHPSMGLRRDQTQPGLFIANTPSLDTWIMQMAEISYRPELLNIFNGSEPVALSFGNSEDNSELNWFLGGSLELQNNPAAILKSIQGPPKIFSLDKYISSNAAAFTILQLEPQTELPSDSAPSEFDLDQYLKEHPEQLRSISSSLDDELAFVTFAESGAESTSEYMFLRKLKDPSALRSALSALSSAAGGIRQDENSFTVQSRWLGWLFGSEMNKMTGFYITITDGVAILAQRRGLAESVSGDADRRRVMFYDDDYMMVRDNLENELSSLTYVDARQFGTYIKPWLKPQNYVSAIVSNLDLLVISSISADNGSTLDVEIASFQREVTDESFRERWVFPVSSNEITGKPLLADITASGRNEIIFSTNNGDLYVIATDGTEVFRTDTGTDVPVGPPVVFDWYGNNQNVILQAAGNKIYAWNMNGSLLPNFPISLNEDISTPLTIEDITRNGIAEIILATADRNLHILNSRGQAISGWPQSVNSVITDKPLITTIGEERLIFAVSENAVHGWQVSGQVRDGFPVFLDTPLNGSPVSHGNHLLGGGRDGSLYSIGSSTLFSDTLSTMVSSDDIIVQKLQVSPNPINAVVLARNTLIRNEGEFVREDLIVVQSSNGSLFLYNNDGELRFTKSMGQPSSSDTGPQIIDIDRDQRQDIVSVADFGRLYAWNILTEERLYGLPTSGMQYQLITDLYGDGNNEIIAFTSEGLRCWTILNTTTESEQE